MRRRNGNACLNMATIKKPTKNEKVLKSNRAFKRLDKLYDHADMLHEQERYEEANTAYRKYMMLADRAYSSLSETEAAEVRSSLRRVSGNMNKEAWLYRGQCRFGIYLLTDIFSRL